MLRESSDPQAVDASRASGLRREPRVTGAYTLVHSLFYRNVPAVSMGTKKH